MSTSRRSFFAFSAFHGLLLALSPSLLHAQVSTHLTYEEHIKRARTFSPLDEDLFGDRVSVQDGALAFAFEDVAIPTQSGLRVAIGRKSAANYEAWNTPEFSAFGQNWDLDVPYMMATYDTRDGWNAQPRLPNGTANYNRCTSGTISPAERVGPWPNYYTQVIYAHMYWKGVQINIPGSGQEQMLKLNSGQILPADGGSYYGTTKSAWRVGCLPILKNGVGEGFTVKLRNGVTYYFDWMATRKAADLTDNNSVDALGNAYEPWHLLAPLTDVYLFATKAVDRFGNTVTYTYDPVRPQRITKIESSDGARLDVQYNQDGLISAVTAGNRVWTYSYNGRTLESLQLPDGSKWTFSGDFRLLSSARVGPAFWGSACQMDQGNMNANSPADPASLWTLTITHPSGAKGDFTIRPLYHGMNNAPGGCGAFGSQQTGWSFGTWGIPSVYAVQSLHLKKIYGAGLTDRTWSYAYSPSWSFQSQCGSGCASTSQTTVTTNDGVVRRYTYGNDYFSNYKQLISQAVEKNSVVFSTTTNTYMTSNSGQPFPSNAGDIPMSSGLSSLYGNPIQFKNLPLKTTTSSSDGATYTRNIVSFDQFVRPTSIQKYSSLSQSKTESTEYHDNLSLWVLGQVKKQTTTNASPNGQTTTASMVSSEVEYNAQALPWKTYKFGKLQQILSYWPDGSVNTVTDGRGNVTWLGDYSRGIPRLIGHPDGTTESASVDGNGWITAVTDEIGAKTCYGYDAMGRVSSITYPSETQLGVCDTSRWHQTTIATEFINTPEHGIAAGHWRTALRHGPNAHINTYYDAMLRPVLEEKLDLNNIAGTLSQVVKRYDTSGRLSFQSYPTTNVGDAWTVTQGVRTFYDALDRVTRVEQDSEFGTPLATTTEYLPGLKTRVTNPRGFQTTTEYMAWDQPSYDLPILSQQPEGKTIQIARHPQFGWPLSLTQRNAANTLSQTRRYVYDSHALLCKTIEPETGATWFGYDAAGNLAASSAGLSLPDAMNCNWSEGANSSRKVTRTYDQRNRLSTLNFPDGRGNQIWTYANDGLPASITTYNGLNNTNPVVNAYTYNNRRLLAGETTSQPGTYTWSIGYGYDAIGNLSNQTYPTGLNIDYAPNALGQPTKAGTYATGAQYYPNGALKQFTYGNGIVHTMTQNARQLPQRVTSSGGALDYSYVYDANGNPEHIANELVAGYDPRDRWMGYDGLDRLTDAGSASFGGDHWHRYTYDALDNMKSWKLAGVKDYAEYVYDNATNRLTNIRNTAGATVVGFGYDPQGNLNNKNGQGYDFDYGNRLREVTSKESYRYDGLGRRVQTTKTDGSKTTLWLYSQAGQMLFSSDWDGANYANQKTHENVYLAGSVIAIIDHDWPSNAVIATKYQHTDALGSPVAVTNASGAVIDRNDYEPYGAIIGKPTYSGIGYTGHVMDGATGLTYMQQRYYDQSIGRFLSVDPVTANAKNGRNFSRYKYAENNPYGFIDPDGRCSKGSTGFHTECRTNEDANDEAEEPPQELETIVVIGSPQTTTTTLPQRPVVEIPPFPWATVGSVILTYGPRISLPLLLITPSELGSPACEMPGGPLCERMMSEMEEIAPKDAPPGTVPIDKAKSKYRWSKDVLHGIKDGATGGMGTGKTWVGVAPDGTVGINEGGKWSPQGHVDELEP